MSKEAESVAGQSGAEREGVELMQRRAVETGKDRRSAEVCRKERRRTRRSLSSDTSLYSTFRPPPAPSSPASAMVPD